MEIIRLRQLWISRILKIQRLYRGHLARLLLPKYRITHALEVQKEKYLNERESQRIKIDRQRAFRLVTEAYKKERAEEYTLRATQRIEPASWHDGGHMKAYAASFYASDNLPDKLNELVGIDWQYRQEQHDLVEEQVRWPVSDLILVWSPLSFFSWKIWATLYISTSSHP
jgi:hypothetical protein